MTNSRRYLKIKEFVTLIIGVLSAICILILIIIAFYLAFTMLPITINK